MLEAGLVGREGGLVELGFAEVVALDGDGGGVEVDVVFVGEADEDYFFVCERVEGDGEVAGFAGLD